MFEALGVLKLQIFEIWKRFGINQKTSIILVFLACLAAFGGLIYWSTRPDYRLLYSGLSLTDASAMREKLLESKINVTIGDAGRSLFVPANDVYSARLMLASEGFPKEVTTGFELFEQPKFGLTDFAQQINYQRALQGELERTLTAMNNIQSARVTLVLPKERLFATESEKKARASIMLTLLPGATLPGAQVRSVTHLVASAVPGLMPDNITVADQHGRLLSAASPAQTELDHAAQAGDQFTLRRSVETQLEKNVQEMLDAFLGDKRSVVKVSADMDFSRIEKRLEQYDKEGRVVKAERIMSESSARPGAAGSPVGATVNVPVQNPGNAQVEQAQAKTKKENIETEYLVPGGVESVSRTGARVQRLSVSVCIAKGGQPRSDEEMKSISELVQAAVGYVNDPAGGRADSVEVKEMDFVIPETVPVPLIHRLPFSLESIARGAAMAMLLLAVFLAGRRIMRSIKVEGVDVGAPVRSLAGGGRPAEAMVEEHREVDVDLYETLQNVKEDPKKAAAWITRAIEGAT